MAEFWRTKQFKVLQITWNKKLEKTGFDDCEVELKTGRALKQRASNAYRQANPLERESRLEYYCFLTHLVQNTIFPSELEKLVMEKHSDGHTIEEIVKKLNEKGIKRHRETISFIIKRWQVTWGLRKWSLKQMK